MPFTFHRLCVYFTYYSTYIPRNETLYRLTNENVRVDDDRYTTRNFTMTYREREFQVTFRLKFPSAMTFQKLYTPSKILLIRIVLV